jgi:hypothetical protein
MPTFFTITSRAQEKYFTAILCHSGQSCFELSPHTSSQCGMPLAFKIAENLTFWSRQNVPVSRAQHDIHLPVPAQEPIIVLVWQKVRRAVEIAVVIVIPVQKLMDVEGSAHAYAVGHHVGMLERKIHRVIAAETASGHRQPGRTVFPA